MNTASDGPLKDIRIRKALNLAINREDLVRYDSKGNGTVLATLTMPGEEGHNPDLKPYPYDPEQAKRLLAEAGVKTPLVLKTHVRAQGCPAHRQHPGRPAQEDRAHVELDIAAVSSDAEALTARVHVQEVGHGHRRHARPHVQLRSSSPERPLAFEIPLLAGTHDDVFDGLLLKYIMTVDDPKTGSSVSLEAVGATLDKYIYDQVPEPLHLSEDQDLRP